MLSPDNDAIIEMDFNDEVRATVTEQFKKQLPPNYEFDEASFIEFIMLLVSNRRSKAQICREMTPFVGDDASSLVTWLFNTLNNLKAKMIPPAVKGRLSSVVVAPSLASTDVDEQPPVASLVTRAALRKLPSATRLLANAAKDAVKSTAEPRRAPPTAQLDDMPRRERRARFQTQSDAPAAPRQMELRTRKSLDVGSSKRSRSPRGAVMDIEAKRLKAHRPQNVDQILEKKLSSPKHAPLTLGRTRAMRSSPPNCSATALHSGERETNDTGPPIRRLRIDSMKLDRLLDRKLCSPELRTPVGVDLVSRRVDSKTFTVSISNNSVEAKLNGALEPERRPEPKVMFKAAVAATKLGVVSSAKQSTSVDAGLPAPKKSTRCSFWPSCDKGDACVFVHPALPCKYWPSCQFGDKCLYIHDKNLTNVFIPCKFGTKCTRGFECKFSHPNQTNGGNEGEVKVCRFDKRCTKISCSFKHPERERTEYYNERLRDIDDDDEDVTVVLSNTLPLTPTRAF